jgi:squalene-hopene/tetraprenyl-beta-curcumene cyclase
MKISLFLSILILLLNCSHTINVNNSNTRTPQSSLNYEDIITNLQESMIANKKTKDSTHEFFDMTAYLGTHITSMYFLSLFWTNDMSKEKYIVLARKHKEVLLLTQNDNGGWYRVLDSNLKDSSDLSATITNYWFLKATGEDIDSQFMQKARDYILKNGSLKKADILTRIFLSLFNNYNWDLLPKIPYILFNKRFPLNDQKLAAWMSPHILPIAILRAVKAERQLDHNLNLNELNSEKYHNQDISKDLSEKDSSMINKLISTQAPMGSWGGYVIASIFGRMVLDLSLDSKIQEIKNKHELIEKSKINSQKFLDQYLFDVEKSSFLGATQDGHIWDSALFTLSLMESGYPKEKLAKVLNQIKEKQNENGGFPFGNDFEKTPDVDDTAIVLLAFKQEKEKYSNEIKKALSYLEKMQNKDGGFAAFSKNNHSNFILNFFTKPFQDSADIFDESSPDVTGHVLEALGNYGYNESNSKVVKKIIKYLRSNQEKDGSFYGRWGINYLYGTGAVLSGLKAISFQANDPLVSNAINYLLKKQNHDGGFGESTLSYSNKEWSGKGVSTPTQTAFALIGMIEYLPKDSESILRGINFLEKNFDYKIQAFSEKSVTGTGHPNVCYMVYPAYRYAFPLLLLARYQKLK